MFLDESDDVVAIYLCTRLRLNHGSHSLSPLLVGYPDDSAILYRWVPCNHMLDLGAVHVEPTGDDSDRRQCGSPAGLNSS